GRHHRRISPVVEQTICNHHPNRRITIGQRPEQHRLTRRWRPEERCRLRVILSKELLNTAPLGEKNRVSHCHLLERPSSPSLAPPAPAEGTGHRCARALPERRHSRDTEARNYYLCAPGVPPCSWRHLPPRRQTPAVIR